MRVNTHEHEAARGAPFRWNWFAWGGGTFVTYVLLSAPAGFLVNSGSSAAPLLSGLYRPLFILGQSIPPFGAALNWYFKLWGVY